MDDETRRFRASIKGSDYAIVLAKLMGKTTTNPSIIDGELYHPGEVCLCGGQLDEHAKGWLEIMTLDCPTIVVMTSDAIHTYVKFDQDDRVDQLVEQHNWVELKNSDAGPRKEGIAE